MTKIGIYVALVMCVPLAIVFGLTSLIKWRLEIKLATFCERDVSIGALALNPRYQIHHTFWSQQNNEVTTYNTRLRNAALRQSGFFSENLTLRKLKLKSELNHYSSPAQNKPYMLQHIERL